MNKNLAVWRLRIPTLHRGLYCIGEEYTRCNLCAIVVQDDDLLTLGRVEPQTRGRLARSQVQGRIIAYFFFGILTTMSHQSMRCGMVANDPFISTLYPFSHVPIQRIRPSKSCWSGQTKGGSTVGHHNATTSVQKAIRQLRSHILGSQW